jgi:hypothetical protein
MALYGGEWSDTGLDRFTLSIRVPTLGKRENIFAYAG